MLTLYRPIGLVLLVVLAACGGKDLAQTPEIAAAPEMRITNGAFVPESGRVRIRWSQTGSSGVATYALERQVDVGEYVRVAEIKADALTSSVGGAQGIEDTQVVAGEEALYRLVAETSDNRTFYSDIVKVLVPGASLQDVVVVKEDASARLRWRPGDEQALVYEIVRQIGDAEPEVIFQAEKGTTEFEERLLGDVLYTYRVQTALSSGARITSRPQTAGLYLSQGSKQLRSGSGHRMRLGLVHVGSAGAIDPVACIFDGRDFEIWNLRGLGSAGDLTLSTSELVQALALEPASVSFAGHNLRSIVNPTGFIVGIQPGTRQLAIQIYTGGSQLHVWNPAPETWPIEPQHQRTAAVVGDEQGRLFVAAGGQLKAFWTADNRFSELGSASIPATTDPGGLAATKTSVWLSLPDENRLFTGSVNFADGNGALLPITWQDVPLPSNAHPEALTVNQHGNVLVMDLRNRKIWVLDSDGGMLTYLELDGSGFEFEGGLDGDLAAGRFQTQDLLYVANAFGQILRFKTE